MPNQSSLTEKELLDDLLNQEKHFMNSYSIYISEGACPNLRQLMTSQFNQICNDQYQIFDCMRQKGFYQIKDAQDADVQQAKQKFAQMQSQMQ